MAYSEAAVTRAQQRREGQIKAHRQQREALRREVFDKLPQARELDRQLRQTAPKVLAAALRQGLDQQAALAALRRENLALQGVVGEAPLVQQGRQLVLEGQVLPAQGRQGRQIGRAHV